MWDGLRYRDTRNRKAGVTSNGGKSGGFGSSTRHSGCRLHPVRGRNILHRDARLDGRRRRQDQNPKTGDPGRRLQPGRPDNDPYYFFMFNANKKSVTINLKTPRGLEIVKELLKKADVTVENMAPGTIERLGLAMTLCLSSTRGSSVAKSKALARGAV
jgi:hypothetical protein